jgi:hypothetical protein
MIRRISFSLFVGMFVGALIGMVIGWTVLPAQPAQSTLQDLSLRAKDDYTVMVAQAFAVDGDTMEAIERLAPLRFPNVIAYVQDVTERFISAGGVGREGDIRVLVRLSCALGRCTPPMQPFL